MAEALLQELSNADIDWMVTTGRRETIAAGTTLIKPCQKSDAVYVLLDGALDVIVPQTTGDQTVDRAIDRLVRGEMAGESGLFLFCIMADTVKAAEDSLVLAIPRQQLVDKLEQDVAFSAHFHRAVALILAARLRRILQAPDQLSADPKLPMKEALFVFSELRDSDVDWLTANGRIEKMPPGKVLINAGRPVDALYFILDGLLATSVPESNSDPLALCFQGLDRSSTAQKIVSYLSKGEMAGALAFLDANPTATLRAAEETLILAIPRQQLATKLQQDLGFASRFYRVLVIQILNNLQIAMDSISGGNRSYAQDQDLDEDIEYGDELCMSSLGQLSQGAMKFNWMLKRLGVGR